MIQARYMYENSLVGEWVDVTTESILYINQEYKHTLVGVQFRETNDLPQRRNKKSWNINTNRRVVSNG